MNKLSVYERPVHCTDAKRETLYIKENDVWEKDIDKTRIRAAIKETSITTLLNHSSLKNNIVRQIFLDSYRIF